MSVSDLTNGCKSATLISLPEVTVRELATLRLGVEDRIADLKLRLATGTEFGATEESMQHRREWLAVAESVLEKLSLGVQ